MMIHTTNKKKIYSVSSHVQALILQEVLAQAGIPVDINKSHQGQSLDLYTESKHVFDARNILTCTSLSVESSQGL